MYRILITAILVIALDASATSANAQAPATTQTDRAAEAATRAAEEKRQKEAIRTADVTAAAGLLDTLVRLDEEVDSKFSEDSKARSTLEVDARARVLNVGELTTRGRQIGNINQFLFRADNVSRRIKRRTICETPTDQLCSDLTDIQDLIHRLLERRNIGWSMAAILRVSLMVGDAGDGAGEFFNRNEALSKTFDAEYVDFELPHWGDGLGRLDGTITGHFGFAPVAAVVRERPASANASPNKPTALYMPGFSWGTAFRGNLQLSKSELSVVASTGSERLSDLTTKLGAGDAAVIGEVLRNDVGRWAWRHGLGLEYRYFGAHMDFVHHDASRLLTPRLSLGVGIQYAERFRAKEELNDFGRPWRLNTRVSVNVVEWVRDTAKRVQSNDPFTVRVVFENDRPLRKGDPRVPAGNRLYIEGGADLLKAFGFGEAETEAAAPAANGDAEEDPAKKKEAAKPEAAKKPGR